MGPYWRKILTVGVVVAILGAGGAASAYWVAPNLAGAGTGSTGNTTGLSLSPGVTLSGLYPGGQASLQVTISNPNLSPVSVSSIVIDSSQGSGGVAVDPTHSGCSTNAVSFTAQSNGGAGWNIPARAGLVDGSVSVTLLNAVLLSSGAANGCQGATFTLYLKAGP